MTRKEEIIQVALKYMGGKWDFINGAEWSDNHPIKGLVNINAICGWLITNLNDYIDTGFIGEYTTFEGFRIDDLIKDLRKAYE